MGLSQEELNRGIDALAARDSNFARALGHAGYPPPRIRPPGYTTLLRTIVGQQVSVAAATSIWNKLEAAFGEGCPVEAIAAADFDALRACGLSGQKQSYAKSLAELIIAGELDVSALPADDEEAIALLTKVKGIGRWSAEIYLLFAEGRPDIWPAGDLAVQEAIGRIFQLGARPSEKQTRELGEVWRPYRGAAAIFSWHCYNMDVI
ncbi:DNA-3-methyladenine glycosylase family protein [Sphingopyxis sp. MWB1]|uniref:DNA-3-methyladenine glycosylase family protein n=1 Tax=Sphingopyxis sp. MWB1 TaxID=1537715 RepID=UPI00051A72AB|nr:DNA-3-methyladenine glycosylase [Sphingopyxis sp. MWB1]